MTVRVMQDSPLRHDLSHTHGHGPRDKAVDKHRTALDQ